MRSSDVILILGAGPRLGLGVARKFATNGYEVVIASRSIEDKALSPEGYFQVRVDLSQPTTIPHVFETIRHRYGKPPNVVVFNGALRELNPPDDPFSVSFQTMQVVKSVGFESVYVAAQEAMSGFADLPASTPKTFIFTGNTLNQISLPQVFSFTVSKRAASTLIEYGANAYGSKGYRFYYADERKLPDFRPAGEDRDGEAHGEMYWQLAQPGKQEAWLVTFVKGKGRIECGGVDFDGTPAKPRSLRL